MKDISRDLTENRSRLNGVEVVFESGRWVWADTHEAVGEGIRPCPHCGKLPGPNGEDGCLGHLPGVMHACCGHGIEDGYLIFENGLEIDFRLLKIPIHTTPSREWKSIRDRQPR